MKNTITLLLTTFFVFSSLYAQDYDVYKRTKDDNMKVPEIYKNMLLEEYQMLSRDIRMMDMSYAMIVPGYIHFKAKENKRGYQILVTRLVGYAGLAVYYSHSKHEGKNIWDYIKGNDDDIDLNYKYLFTSSMTLIISSYLYDWIHGKFMLEKKQENIKYKYGIKFKMDEVSFNSNKHLTPSISVSLNF